MKYLSVSKARASLLRLVDNLDERTAIMRNGQPVAVLLDFDDYRALCAAQALARDVERLAEIQAVARRVRAGDLDGFTEVPEVPDRHQTRVSYTAPPPVDVEAMAVARAGADGRNPLDAVLKHALVKRRGARKPPVDRDAETDAPTGRTSKARAGARATNRRDG